MVSKKGGNKDSFTIENYVIASGTYCNLIHIILIIYLSEQNVKQKLYFMELI